MRPLTFRAAVLAALVAAPAAHADMVIIQQGQFPGPAPFVHHMPQRSAFGMAEAFIQDTMAQRAPWSIAGLLVPTIAPDPAPVLTTDPLSEDLISFAGAWSLVEVRGVNGDMMDVPEDRLETMRLTVDQTGRFDASTGCNPITGTMTLNAGALTVDAELDHEMMCIVGMDFEYALTVALNETAFFAHGPETLVLLDDEGYKLARFDLVFQAP